MLAPASNQDFGLPQRVKYFAIEKFVPELAVEALVVAIFPRAARFDVERLHANPAEPVAHGRPPVMVVDDARYKSGAEEFAIDVAARYSHTLGDWDLALSGFYGTSREPVFEQVAASSELRPFYDRIGQIGLEAQYTSGAWLWKFEGIQRTGYGETFQAAVGGVEYTFYQALGSSADVGVLAEYLYDNRSNFAPVTVFNNDLFVATRVALNDTQDSSLLVGGVFDLEKGSTSIRLEAERRLGQNFQIGFKGQFFAYAEATDPLRVFGQDDYITFTLTRFF